MPGPPKEPNAASALDWAKPPQAKCRCGCGYHPTAIPQSLGRRWLSSTILLFANGSGISEKLFCKWFPGFRTFISRKESRTENSPTAPREIPDSSRKLPDSSPKNSATTSGKHDDNPRQLSRNFPPNRVKESTNLCCLRFLANR